MNPAVPLSGFGRFRVNIFRQRGEASILIRYIDSIIPYFEDMSLPPVLGDIIMGKRGLVLVVGAIGSGNMTTLAAMIGHRNRHSNSRIQPSKIHSSLSISMFVQFNSNLR